MKYILKFITPIFKLAFALTIFIFGNMLYFISYIIWNLKFPTIEAIKSHNEHYRRRNGYTLYYKNYINYTFDRKGYTKLFK